MRDKISLSFVNNVLIKGVELVIGNSYIDKEKNPPLRLGEDIGGVFVNDFLMCEI